MSRFIADEVLGDLFHPLPCLKTHNLHCLRKESVVSCFGNRQMKNKIGIERQLLAFLIRCFCCIKRPLKFNPVGCIAAQGCPVCHFSFQSNSIFIAAHHIFKVIDFGKPNRRNLVVIATLDKSAQTFGCRDKTLSTEFLNSCPDDRS